MYNCKLPSRQLTAWLAAAIIPPVVQLTAGASWVSVALVCVLCLLFTWVRWSYGTEPSSKLIALLHWLLLGVILGTVCQSAVRSWPGGEHPVVGLILLGLAVWSAWKGTSAAARVGCVLFWFVLVLYLVLLGAGVKDVQIQWLVPTEGDVDGFACVLLLTPGVASIHLNKKEMIKPRLLLIGIFCTAAAAITVGVLSIQVASVTENAFYEMTRSLNLLGQARRFEAVLSAGMTLGWFSLITFYLTISGNLAEKHYPGREKWSVIVSAAIAAVILLCDLHIPGMMLLILSAVFWVLLPLLAQGLVGEKKS